MKNHYSDHPKARTQGGVALVVGLLLLVVMSMIGVAMMSSTSLETMMAGGARESGIAFQAAEAALRDAENSVEATTSLDAFSGSTTGQLGEATLEPDLFDAATWNSDASETIMSIEYLSGSGAGYPEMPAGGQPRYILKHVADVDLAVTGQNIAQEDVGEGVHWIVSVVRATARGTSRDGSAVATVQSYYGKQYD